MLRTGARFCLIWTKINRRNFDVFLKINHQNFQNAPHGSATLLDLEEDPPTPLWGPSAGEALCMVASTWPPPTAFYLLLHLESGCYLAAVACMWFCGSSRRWPCSCVPLAIVAAMGSAPICTKQHEANRDGYTSQGQTSNPPLEHPPLTLLSTLQSRPLVYRPAPARFPPN